MFFARKSIQHLLEYGVISRYVCFLARKNFEQSASKREKKPQAKSLPFQDMAWQCDMSAIPAVPRQYSSIPMAWMESKNSSAADGKHLLRRSRKRVARQSDLQAMSGSSAHYSMALRFTLSHRMNFTDGRRRDLIQNVSADGGNRKPSAFGNSWSPARHRIACSSISPRVPINTVVKKCPMCLRDQAVGSTTD